MSDPSKKLALRIHDECNGSDVFCSDICTCRPYLIFGIEEAVKEAQNGGSGVVIYFRKEGRALGEVTKVGYPPIRPVAALETHANTVPYVETLGATQHITHAPLAI
jgi:GTP cyclohydrolase II